MLVSSIIWIPMVAVLVLPFMPERTADQRGRIRVLGLAAASSVLFLVLMSAMIVVIDPTQVGGLAESRQWVADFPFASVYHVDIDGITLPLLQVTGLLFCCATLYSWKRDESIRLYIGCLLILETGVVGVLCAQDLLILTVFWGLQIIPIYLLLRLSRSETGADASSQYAFFSLSAMALLITGAILLAVHVPATGTPPTHTFDMATVLTQSVGTHPTGVARDSFVLLLLGCALAVGMVPLHRWIIEASSTPDAGLAALITGTVSKLGVLVALRVVVQAYPTLITDYSLLFVIAGAALTGWGMLRTWSSPDLREALAYFSIGQTGIAVMAFGSSTILSIVGLVLLLVAQGLTQALLTFVANATAERAKTSRIERLGGLAWQAPRLAGFWMLGALVALGIPLLPGFAALLVTASGGFINHHFGAVAVLIGSIAGGVVLLTIGRRVFLGEAKEQHERVRDVSALDLSILVPIVVGIFLYGVLPGKIIPVIEATARVIASRVSGP